MRLPLPAAIFFLLWPPSRFPSFLPRRCLAPLAAAPSLSAPAVSYPALQISGRRRAVRFGRRSASFAAAGMRRGGVLLLVACLVAVAVAAAEEVNTNIIQAETHDDNNIAHSDVGKVGRHDETNTDRGQHDEAKNDTDENNKKDNSTEGTSTTKDEAAMHHLDKDISTAKSSHVTDFSQDPLIKECEPSHRCVIENRKFIACLKVPGEDSLALSLLMDNKGMNPLDVSITTPDFVTSTEDTVHVKANDHNKTQVSISSSDAANMAIVLRVAEETCNISIHRAIARETNRVMRMRLPSIYMLVPAFVLIGVVGACIKLRRIRNQNGGPAYQKLDVAELPVSTGGKKEADQSDQWDDNWGDEWDDEEASLTPTKPMPSLSSKGLASRRSTKDGWKD